MGGESADLADVTSPAQASIDLGGIRDHIALLRAHARATDVMAMVKAEAYGHGMEESARAALAGGATWLGVAKLAEGLRLRAAVPEVPIMVCLGVPGEPYDQAIGAGLDLTAGTAWLVEEIAAAARMVGRTARVHLKADTGMSRG